MQFKSHGAMELFSISCADLVSRVNHPRSFHDYHFQAPHFLFQIDFPRDGHHHHHRRHYHHRHHHHRLLVDALISPCYVALFISSLLKFKWDVCQSNSITKNFHRDKEAAVHVIYISNEHLPLTFWRFTISNEVIHESFKPGLYSSPSP